MRIPSWRLALTGGAVVVLLALGIGFVAASTNVHPSTAATAQAAPTAAPDESANAEHHGFGLGLRKWLAGRGGHLALAKHLVHVIATVTDRDGNLITIQLDHGTVQSISTNGLTIAEAGGTAVTVTTNADSKVFLGRDSGRLTDVKVGQTVFVQSRIDGSTLAKRILVVPATGDDAGG